MTNINISVVLVSGGYPNDPPNRDFPDHIAVKSVELLHTNGSRICSLPSFQHPIRLHTQTGLTQCGGDHGSDHDYARCVGFDNVHFKTLNGDTELRDDGTLVLFNEEMQFYVLY